MPQPTPHASTLPLEDARADDVPRGCAWFDSSLDLLAGVRVRELDLADPRCSAGFLDGWLAWVTARDLCQPALRA